MTKIINSIRNLRDRVSANVTIKIQNILFYAALFLVFLIAILIRLSPMLESEQLIKAFDPWIQYYNTEYLAENGIYEYFHWNDLKSWYPEGIDRSYLRPGLQFTTVAFYNLLNFFGISVSLYDVCYFFPPFMAGLTIIATYFLGKEILDRKCGLLAAFFLAFSPGYMQRTIAGFYDNETLGVFAIIMTFLFFLKAVKTGKITYSVIGGVFSGYLALSWGGYEFVYFAIPIICIFLIILGKYNANVLIAYAGVQGIGLLVSALYENFEFGRIFSSLDVGGLLFLTALIIFYHILYTRKKTNPKLFNNVTNFLKWGLIPLAITIAVITWVSPGLIPFGIGDRLQSVINPLFRNQIQLVASVAEHMPTAWSAFYFDILIPMLLLPLGVYFCFRRYNAADIFLLTFTLLLFYFTGSMVRIMLAFAPAAALMGAYGLTNVLKIFGSIHGKRTVGISRKRTKLLKRKRTLGKKEIYSVYLIVGFLCFVQINHAIDISIQMAPGQIVPGGVLHDWEESLTWMKSNLPGDTVVVSWWDYGYWLTPIGNMTTVNDNANINFTRNGLVGMSLMQTNEIYSAKILRLLQADYVLVYFGFLHDGLGGDEGKWQWMLRICNDYYEYYKSLGLEEDNWEENSVFEESKYINQENFRYDDAWFNSQLVKLLFWGVPTSDPGSLYGQGSIFQNYIDALANNKDANDIAWQAHVPQDGNYQSDVFTSQGGFFSRNKLVKLFKIDYTALDSKFTIKDPQIFDSGYGTVKVKNIGTKDLDITGVKVNGNSSSFELGKSIDDNVLSVGEEDIIWFDTTSDGESIYNINDAAKIEVLAESKKPLGVYDFSNTTSNFFVKQAELSKIQIIRENSEIIYNEETGQDDGYIQVKNIGNNPIVVDKYYVNSEENIFTNIEYINGSSIIEPGESSTAYLRGSPVPFSMIGTNNIIGTINNVSVMTKNGIVDTTSFTSKRKIIVLEDELDFQLAIIPQERIHSPELEALTNASIRYYIQPDYDTNAVRYDNGTTQIDLTVKNIGNDRFSLYDLSLLNSDWSLIDPLDYQWTVPGSKFLDLNEETRITIDVDSGIFNVNDEIGFNVTGSFDGTKVASDTGFMHIMNSSDLGDIKLLNKVNGYNATYLNSSSGTGWALIKNVGTIDLTLNTTDCVIIDTTTALNINIVYGYFVLGPQACALIEFEVSQSMNHLDTFIVKVKTEEGRSYELTITAYDYI